MFVAISYFNESFVNLVTITFTTLILIELLNVISEVNTLKPPMIVSMLFTLMIYLLSIVMFRNYFEVSYIDGFFILKVLVLTLAAWLPLHLFKKLMIRWDPN
jgi:phospholipid-translocating ATPase